MMPPTIKESGFRWRYRSLPPGLMAVLVALTTMAASLAIYVPSEFSASFSPIMRQIGGAPVRWDACEPIHYVVNATEGPSSALADTEEAIARVSAASGLQFVYDGPTDEAPSFEREAFQPSRYGPGWAPVLIAWVKDTDNEVDMSLPQVGVGVPLPVKNQEGQDVFVTGLVAINGGFQAAPGFDQTTDLGSIVLHELGHLAGLGHVKSVDEIMFPVASGKSPTIWGSGDTLGLFLLGRATGCLDEPVPQETQGDWDGVVFPDQPHT